MSADTGQLCFVYQTLLAAKAGCVSVTVEQANKRMFGTCTPVEVGARMCVKSSVCGWWEQRGVV